MGENVLAQGAEGDCPPLVTPALRENTLRSFHGAANAGAAFVEFDVQVTMDGVPVVWHDDFGEHEHIGECMANCSWRACIL